MENTKAQTEEGKKLESLEREIAGIKEAIKRKEEEIKKLKAAQAIKKNIGTNP